MKRSSWLLECQHFRNIANRVIHFDNLLKLYSDLYLVKLLNTSARSFFSIYDIFIVTWHNFYFVILLSLRLLFWFFKLISRECAARTITNLIDRSICLFIHFLNHLTSKRYIISGIGTDINRFTFVRCRNLPR